MTFRLVPAKFSQSSSSEMVGQFSATVPHYDSLQVKNITCIINIDGYTDHHGIVFCTSALLACNYVLGVVG